ncbi:RNA polymerase sigma factor [Streptomyces sp. NBC_00190]|uniref:RNA polymerase sigma factor n=1 Tax=unclassified Streptomyces TaxID=2593676 RepID=UPI002E2C16CB|nr:RNA polymerase sigma factor [Streptomyces sp. NBC_00190]WSZ43977.1 RNA polymerase sigma factor [Streptomyces sp. NBC_00868]
MNADEEELLTRSAREPEAFEALVVRQSASLHGYLARRAPDAADDLLAEVWLQAFAGRGGFDAGRGTARAWLFGVARNVLSGHWRRLAQDRPEAHRHEPDSSDPWHAVDRRLDAAALAPQLRETLAGLPAVERDLLLLVAWEQLTPTEAADVVGIPAGTARSRLHRARGRLTAALDSPKPLHLAGEMA